MAELGNALGLEDKNVKVDVEMLDYAYVQECKDVDKVNAILEVLKSGKEGHYPDVNSLLSLLKLIIDM
jgi:hypothetical protein